MNRLLADYSANTAFGGEYVNFTRRNIQLVYPAIAAEIEQTLIRYVHYLKTDFIIMTGEHYPEVSIGIQRADRVAQHILVYRIGKTFDVIFEYFGRFRFIARGTRRIQQIFQKFHTSRIKHNITSFTI